MKKDKVNEKINPLFNLGICHRGLHNKEYTENGLLAFKNAKDHHMAFELDIHLTKDNELVVIHDSELKRVTGKEGIVENLTLKEIKDNYKLLDGETIPTLKEVFDQTLEEVPIVVELKTYNKNHKALAKRAKEELKLIKDKKNIMIISFDYKCLLKFKKKNGFIRLLLVANEPKFRRTYHLKHLFDGLDLDYTFVSEKRVQNYSYNHYINVWTVESKADFDNVYPYVDTVTFQNMDSKYVYDRMLEK